MAESPDLEDDEAPESPGPVRIHRATLPDSASGQRLDRALAEAVPTLSRSRIQALIDAGAVTLDGVTMTLARHAVKPGQAAEIAEPAPAPAEPLPEAIPLAVVYEDPHLLVIDKPAGLVVHPAAGHATGTLVNALLHHCGGALSGIGGVARPGIVHRLDKDTSGLMVVAKSDVAHRGLVAQFADRSLSRTYRAVTWGAPTPPAGRIEAAIGRSAQDRQKMAVTSAGRPAATRYRMIEPLGRRAALIECKLETGRTHQVRVHLAHIGCPLVGDPLYGPRGRQPPVPFARQALHAVALRFVHPVSGADSHFESPLPADLCDLIDALVREA